MRRTWLGSSVDKICVGELVPGGYRMQQVPRQNNMRGGGVAIICKSSVELTVIASTRDGDFNTFEFMDWNIVLKHFSLRLTVIYRPPPSQKNGLSTHDFLEHEWPLFLSKYVTIDKIVLIVGDLNFHLDKLTDRDTVKFTSCLETFGLKQLVRGPTHVAGHTLDILITRDNDSNVSNIEVRDPGLSDSDGKIKRDHFAVIFDMRAEKPAPVRKSYF